MNAKIDASGISRLEENSSYVPYNLVNTIKRLFMAKTRL